VFEPYTQDMYERTRLIQSVASRGGSKRVRVAIQKQYPSGGGGISVESSTCSREQRFLLAACVRSFRHWEEGDAGSVGFVGLGNMGGRWRSNS